MQWRCSIGKAVGQPSQGSASAYRFRLRQDFGSKLWVMSGRELMYIADYFGTNGDPAPVSRNSVLLEVPMTVEPTFAFIGRFAMLTSTLA